MVPAKCCFDSLFVGSNGLHQFCDLLVFDELLHSAFEWVFGLALKKRRDLVAIVGQIVESDLFQETEP